jgi:threonine/homoserine efflux transporter RhtA
MKMIGIGMVFSPFIAFPLGIKSNNPDILSPLMGGSMCLLVIGSALFLGNMPFSLFSKYQK